VISRALFDTTCTVFSYHIIGRIWFETNKAFGWEVLELRYGGLRIRLESLKERLLSYIDMETDDLNFPEIESELLRTHDVSNSLPALSYSRAATPSRNLGSG
jgi:hypothetical protein